MIRSLWMTSVVGCFTEAPEASIVTQAELEAAVQAAVDAKNNEPDSDAIEAYLQSQDGQALIQTKVQEFLATQDVVTTADLGGYVEQIDYDTFVSQAEAATADLDTRIGTLESDLTDSVLPADPQTVVADCAALLTQLDNLQAVRFAPGILVTLTVAPGIHNCTRPIVITHPQGGQLRIIGNETDPSVVVLQFTGTGSAGFDGFVTNDGNALGWLNGFRLVGTPGMGAALNVGINASIRAGNQLIIEDFYYGDRAYYGGFISHDGEGSVLINDTMVGIEASFGGVIEADHAVVTSTEECSLGLAAPYGGYIRADYITLDLSCQGAFAKEGGAISGFAGALTTSYDYGIIAEQGGFIGWENGSSNSAANDFMAYRGGVIDAQGSSGTTNPPSEPNGFALPSQIFQ